MPGNLNKKEVRNAWIDRRNGNGGGNGGDEGEASKNTLVDLNILGILNLPLPYRGRGVNPGNQNVVTVQERGHAFKRGRLGSVAFSSGNRTARQF